MGVASIYFIRNLRSRSVKIGISEDPAARLASLQTGNEDELLLEVAIPDADLSLERRLHDEWSSLRLRGEWFRSDPRLEAYIAELKRSIAVFSSGGRVAVETYRWLSEQKLEAWVRPWICALTQQHSS